MRLSANVMKWVLPATMLATTGFAYGAPEAAPAAKVREVCVINSRTPEAHTFYGNAKDLAQKVSDANLSIQDRRLYLYTVETNKGAELVFFERDKVGDHFGNQVKVSTWKGASLGDLKEQLNDVMMTNQGKYCIGKKSTDLINAKFELQPAGERGLPSSAADLIPISTQVPQGDFARVTFFLLC
ncbi:hypothetical protein [Polyangium sp. 6x1]|uniref:hypothetical protein n=1 Tax=Polyangium sp. 6x1 TaxID=3042689 RepID=UPI002482D738|nr:hypothetical protein [Polyangium sp. 6x1]MDI1447797.1 hypothetical protein [Polyangium sp. 6x1]